MVATFADDSRYSLFDLARMTIELEALFGRKVDLIDRKSIDESENFIRRREVLETLQVIYAA